MPNRFITCFTRHPRDVSSRGHAPVRLGLHLRLRRLSWVRTGLAPWLQPIPLPTLNGSFAQILYARTLEARRWRRRVPMIRRAARYALLLRICRERGCSREDAKEVVQEAYLRLLEYQRSAKVTDADYLLRRIVVNLSINHYHRAPSNRFEFESVEKLDRRGILVHSDPGPERTLAAQQEVDRVVAVVNAISPRTCQIFIAQRGGYSYEEIAVAFAIKPRTVEKHVASAMLALEQILPAEFASEPVGGRPRG